jgi:hypothetical protein
VEIVAGAKVKNPSVLRGGNERNGFITDCTPEAKQKITRWLEEKNLGKRRFSKPGTGQPPALLGEPSRWFVPSTARSDPENELPLRFRS